MRKERWPGERVFLDNIDTALRSYAQAYIEAAPDYFPDAEEDWPDYVAPPMIVGWVIGIQTLGEIEDDDVDAYIPVVSEGMSTFTASGLTLNMHNFFLEA